VHYCPVEAHDLILVAHTIYYEDAFFSLQASWRISRAEKYPRGGIYFHLAAFFYLGNVLLSCHDAILWVGFPSLNASNCILTDIFIRLKEV
jgi:hypothetical protein